jgi:hypothetical protein
MPISHPFRIAGGRAVLVDEGSPRLAAELAATVLATTQSERGLAPSYGIPDPVGQSVDGDELAGWVEINEPEVEVTAVAVTPYSGGGVTVKATVDWAGRG